MQDYGWKVIGTIDQGLLTTQTRIINRIIWLMFFLLLLFGVFYYLLLRKSVITPIVKLSRNVEQFGEDNYKIERYTSSKDEVGVLNENVIEMSHRIQNLIETVYKDQLMMREAELQSLQAQINPHFLYNTLDTFRWIALGNGEKELASQIQALSHMFGYVLRTGTEVTTVGEEVCFLKDYLEIQKCRFGDRITIICQIDEELADCKVLKLLLQPLVENAFTHGLEQKVGHGSVKVVVRGEGEDILYRVEDDGVGADQKQICRILEGKETREKMYGLKM